MSRSLKNRQKRAWKRVGGRRRRHILAEELAADPDCGSNRPYRFGHGEESTKWMNQPSTDGRQVGKRKKHG